MNAMKDAKFRADLGFDVYSSPDIKDVKRKERGDADTERLFLIGARQKIPSDIKDLLKLSEFKRELLRFLFSA